MKLSPALPVSIAFLAVLSVARGERVSQEKQWEAAVQTFAGVLDGSMTRDALDGLLSDHSWVAPFARNRTESVGVLPDRLAGMRVVSARGCLQPSVTSATDLIADIQADESIDASIRLKLVPADGRDLRGADATMSRWFTTTLEAQAGDPVALVALYDAGRTSATGQPGVPPSMTLLLMRGEFLATDGTPRISRVLYGTLEAAVR